MSYSAVHVLSAKYCATHIGVGIKHICPAELGIVQQLNQLAFSKYLYQLSIAVKQITPNLVVQNNNNHILPFIVLVGQKLRAQDRRDGFLMTGVPKRKTWKLGAGVICRIIHSHVQCVTLVPLCVASPCDLASQQGDCISRVSILKETEKEAEATYCLV